MADGDDLEYLILSFLDRSDGPVGSGAICEWVRQNGREVSEATVGRFLRQLGVQDLTQRSGFKGRTLTEKGQAKLVQLRHERVLAHSSTELVEALRAGDLTECVDVLVARRALEREATRLAAMLATPRDLEALDTLVNRYEAVGNVRATAETDFAFHVRLAEISGNRVIQAATRLIHAQAQSSMIPAPIQLKLKPMSAQQHREIVEAIRAHDPERAESAMVAHLNFVIEVIQRHCQEPAARPRTQNS
ncbi:MAG TPA: FCD domain-containing protein [Symbiobacteriaceae bacterium]